MKLKLTLLALIFQSYSAFAQIYPFYDGKLYGFKNDNRELVIQPKFTRISRLNDGYFAAEVKNYSWIILDSSAIQTHAEDSIYYPYKISETNWIYFRRGKKEGIVDYKGNVILDAVYDDVSYMYGVIKIKKNGKYGLLDLEGNVLVEPIYDEMPYSKDLQRIAVRLDDDWGYISKFGEIKIPFKFYDAEVFANGVAFVAIDHVKWCMIDTLGEMISDEYFRSIEYYGVNSTSFNVTTLEKHAKILDTNGKSLIEGDFHVLGRLEDGYAAFKQKYSDSFFSKYKSYGYVDSLGKKFEYPYENPFNYKFQIPLAPEALAYKVFPLKMRKEIQEFDAYIVPSSSAPSLRYRDTTVEIEYLANRAIHGFLEAPFVYEDHGRLSQVCIVYGLLLDQDYAFDKVLSRNFKDWEKLRKETLQKIVSSEKQRTLMWDWLRPLYKMAFSKLNPFAKKTYKGIAAYLKDYVNNYDLEATEDFLFKQEDQFARLNLKGEYDKHRKISAFVDRLILIHKVISVEDAKRWVNIIADEVESWE